MLAPRLKPGDRIGVVSPSNAITGELIEQLNHGVDFLKSKGFDVVLGEHALSATLGYTASPQEKADDICRMFADPSVKAILCSQGGSTANAALFHLDWDLIRANPKIFLGISDITVLLNAIYQQTGLITFHGNDVMWGFGRKPAPYDWDEFALRLVEGEVGAVHASGERRTIRGGSGEGRLLGGNLPCLLKLAGTPYFPDFAGAILFVEAIGITVEECDVKFTQLKQMGVFDRLRGAIVGYIDGLEDAPVQMHDVLARITAEYNFPILKVKDFGHNCPNTTLPVGARARLDADRQEITLLEACARP